MDIPLKLPEVQRTRVEAALVRFDGAPASLAPVPGGATGALALRFTTPGGERLLRLSDPAADRMRNPDQHACITAASKAGIAPALYACEPETGVLVMDFVAQRPLSDHPGGARAVARELGRLFRTLQAEASFPNAVNFGERLAGLMELVLGKRHFAEGLMAPFVGGLQRLRAAYPWSASAPVAAHCDPNPRNLLYDGNRFWLVDWETACATDSMVDLAILTHETVMGPDAEGAMLEGWLGRPAGQGERDRLVLMKPMTRLYYGLLMLMVTPPPETPSGDLAAPDPADFGARVADGRLPMGSPAMMTELAKITLAGFLADMESPQVQAILGRAS